MRISDWSSDVCSSDLIADHVPEQDVCLGDTSGRLAIVGWGSTFGPIHQAVLRQRAKGRDVSHIHIRHVWPLPKNLGALLKSYEKVIVPERSEEHTSELQSLMRISYAVFCLKKKTNKQG